MAQDPDRRRVLQGLGAAALCFSASRCGRPDPSVEPPRAPSVRARPPARPLVARARRDDVRDASTGRVDAAVLRGMLGAAVVQATGDPSIVEAFRRRFDPSDVVGIKVSTLAGRGLSPHPELVAEIVEVLVQAGVQEGNIVVWDRTDDELQQAGFTLQRDKASVRCMGTNDDYDWTPREWGAGGSCFARLLVEELTALINVGLVKDHDLAGISAGMKSWYGVIHNPNKQHDDGCDPFVAHLANYSLIKDKLRLTLLDALVAQCHGGPALSPRWAWPYGALLVSTDPVAADAVAWQIIEERRREVGLKSLAEQEREPRYIATAGRLGLGENRLEHIALVDA
ncbi:MAG: DUF362 domain-containing protein [Polyangiaceae bacterium]|nr:DUF362 domain-containing protein [Polyangiaceae bacterium]